MPTPIGLTSLIKLSLSDRRHRFGLLLTALGLALLIFAGAFAAILIFRNDSATIWVQHSLEVRSTTIKLLSALQDGEIGQRGYILTDSDEFLTPYTRAVAEIPGILDSLQSLTSDNAAQRARLATMRPAIAAKFASLAQTIELTRNGEGAAAAQKLQSGPGKALMDQLRTEIHDFDEAEQRLLVAREATASDTRTLALAIILVSLLSAAMTSVAVFATNASYVRELLERTSALTKETKQRKEAESILVQAQKMESVGQLAGGIAHDFNNLLTVVIGSLDTIERRAKAGETVSSALVAKPAATALQGARRAAALTQRLLAFSRQQPLAPERLDLNAAVSGISELLARTVGETVKIETVLAGGLWATFVDPSQIENALINLIVNARDAMPNGGLITIETANTHLDDAYVAQFSDVLAGQYVLLSVTDTGSGIPAKILPNVFDPFFTTKRDGKGSGLGLAMIHGFVKQSNGHIRIYSEVDHGTTVKIYLPRAQGNAQRLASPATGALEPRSDQRAVAGEVILLVEDDDGVHDFAVSTLEELGYRVEATKTGADALEWLSRDHRIDLLFTDVVLPNGMNGRQLVDQAIAMKPGLPVLYTTGYTRNAIVHNGRLDADVRLLTKPYTQLDLARSIRSALDAAKAS